jgi:hypothetical protein
MVYQDTLWDITTISELQAALFSFNSTIVALQAAVVDLQQTAQQSSSSTLSATTLTIANEERDLTPRAFNFPAPVQFSFNRVSSLRQQGG